MSENFEKVVWAEGVFLSQQHFQCWDNLHENTARFRSEAYAPLGWGISELKIDKEALKHGLFRLERCVGIFSHGEVFSYDMNRHESLVFDLTKASRDKSEILLCLPLNDQIQNVTGYPSPSLHTAWNATFHSIADKYDGSRKREIMLASPNLFLLCGDQPHDKYATLKIAEIERVGVDHYALSEAFIPSSLYISGSDVLKNMVRRVIELLETKIRVLHERRDQFSGNVTDFGHSDLAHFMLLISLNNVLPELKHCQLHENFHPERLFSALIRVLGTLQAFNTEQSGMVSTPSYQHGDLSATFSYLYQSLLSLIETVMPAKLQGIKLLRESDSLYTVDSIDSSLFAHHTFFVGVYMEAEDTTWIDRFVQHIKVGAREQIEFIVASAMPGVRLTHLQRTPTKLPVKSGYEYFRLDAHGKFWEDIVSSRSLGIFLSHEFEKAKLDILTVQE